MEVVSINGKKIETKNTKIGLLPNPGTDISIKVILCMLSSLLGW